MIRFILLAAALAAINPLCDFLVDRAFRQVHSEPIGYTQAERDGMKKLLDKTLAKPVGHHKAKTGFGERQAQGLADVWGLTAEEIEKPIEIFGRGQ